MDESHKLKDFMRGLVSLFLRAASGEDIRGLLEVDAAKTESVNRVELVVCTPCAAHDTHNGFRWAMFVEFKDRQLLRD